jgi:hypothetical protein
MKKIIVAICGFVVLSSLTSCIDIIEQLIVNNKGGGHFSRTIDMSKMAEMMESLKSMDKDSKDKEEKSEDSPGSIGQDILKSVEDLKKIKGISNVTTKQDTIKQIYTIELDFENDVALNNAFHKLLEQDEDKKVESIFTISPTSLTRSDYNILAGFGESGDDEKSKEAAQMIATLAEEIKYKLTVVLPSPIKSNSNPKAELSDDKKTITIEGSAKDFEDKKVTPGMKLKF